MICLLYNFHRNYSLVKILTFLLIFKLKISINNFWFLFLLKFFSIRVFFCRNIKLQFNNGNLILLCLPRDFEIDNYFKNKNCIIKKNTVVIERLDNNLWLHINWFTKKKIISNKIKIALYWTLSNFSSKIKPEILATGPQSWMPGSCNGNNKCGCDNVIYQVIHINE